MNSRVLVYSPDAELRDAITTWGQQEDSLIIQIVDNTEAIPEAINSGHLAAVILDDSDGELSLTALTHDLATQLPQTRILVFPPSAETDQSEIKDAILHGYLSKPLSTGELRTALRGLLVPESAKSASTAETSQKSITPPTETQTVPKNQTHGGYTPLVEVKPADDELDFLKGWLYEEPEEETVTPLPEGELHNEPAKAQELDDGSIDALNDNEFLPSESGNPVTDLEEFAETTSAITNAEITTDVASITPAELLTLKSTLQPEPESEMTAETGFPPVNLHSLRLHYSCVLIPRDPQHYLVGELAERLGLMLPQVHLKRGWRVTGMSIRPQYMQWLAALPLDVNPVEAVSEIRQITSAAILSNLPELKTSKGEEGFWAPGYLVLSGTLATTSSIMREFIQRTRSLRDLES